MKNPEPQQGQDPASAQQVGLLVRKFYIDQKSAKMRRDYRIHPRWDRAEFWAEVGHLCLDMDARPDQFVLAQFDMDPHAHGPFPNMLKGKTAEKRYRQWRNLARSKVAQAAVGGPMREDYSMVTAAMAQAVVECRNLFPDQPLIRGYRSPLTNIPAWLRVIMYPEDEIITTQWGYKAQQELAGNVVLLNQCRLMNLPVGRVMGAMFKPYE